MELPANETVVTKYEVDDQLEAPMRLMFGIQLHPDTWSLVFTTAILFLTINAVSSVFQSLKDLPAVAVVVSAYVLVLLLLCVHLLGGLPEPSPERQLLKVLAWLLSTALNFIFAWRFSSVLPLPLPLTAFGWCLAVVTGFLGLYFLVVYRDQEKEDEEVEYCYDCEKLAYISMPNKV